MTPLASAQAQVRDLAQCVVWLSHNLLPGTARPYHAPTMSAEKRAEKDAHARQERLERVDLAPGDGTVPYSLDVAELLTDILICADNMAELVGQAAGVDRMEPASSAMADPGPFVAYVGVWIEQAAEVDKDVLRNVDNQFSRLVRRSHEALGLVMDGQLLGGALCPFCGGRSDSKPTGGAPTLRVRTLPGVGPVVVCEGGMCEPGKNSGTLWRGLPAWPLWEWEWLAGIIEKGEAA